MREHVRSRLVAVFLSFGPNLKLYANPPLCSLLMAGKTAEAEVQPAAAAMEPMAKVKLYGELAEIGALALQLVCIADDLDDKFDEDPGLLEKMSVSREDVGRTMRFLRKLSDKARAAQSQVQEELVGMVGPDAATTDTQPEPTAAAEPVAAAATEQ